MTDGLFDLNPGEDAGHSVQAAAASDSQVQQIRKGWAECGLTSQEERRQFVESVANRSVPSLRDLTASEARRVLDMQTRRAAAERRSEALSPIEPRSAWDDREHETWIDRL